MIYEQSFALMFACYMLHWDILLIFLAKLINDIWFDYEQIISYELSIIKQV